MWSGQNEKKSNDCHFFYGGGAWLDVCPLTTGILPPPLTILTHAYSRALSQVCLTTPQ